MACDPPAINIPASLRDRFSPLHISRRTILLQHMLCERSDVLFLKQLLRVHIWVRIRRS